MANQGRWTVTNLTTVLSTELNSLANGANAISASAYDNTTNLDMFCDIEIFVGNVGNSTGAGSAVFLEILESVDGTNFPSQAGNSGSQGIIASQGLVVSSPGAGGTNSERLVYRNVRIPPTKFKLAFTNFVGNALPASGNTVKILTYSWNTNA